MAAGELAATLPSDQVADRVSVTGTIGQHAGARREIVEQDLGRWSACSTQRENPGQGEGTVF